MRLCLHRKRPVAALVAVVVLCLASVAGAALGTFSTPAGTTLDGLPVSARATFVTLTDNIVIFLENSQNNPRAIIQNVSDLGFALSTGQTTGTLAFSEALERTINADRTFTDGVSGPTGWLVESTVNNPLFVDGLRLCVLCAPVGPAHTLIGGPGVLGTYTIANNSIASNASHNPFITGLAAFIVEVPGVTDSTTISDVVFSFGTTEGRLVAAPEPSTLLLLGSGLVALGLVGRKKLQAKN